MVTRESNFVLHLNHKSIVILPEPSPVLDELSLLVCLQKPEESGTLAKEYPHAGKTHWKSPRLMVFQSDFFSQGQVTGRGRVERLSHKSGVESVNIPRASRCQAWEGPRSVKYSSCCQHISK